VYQNKRLHVPEDTNLNKFCTLKCPSMSPLGLQNDNLYEELEQCTDLPEPKLVLLMINGQTNGLCPPGKRKCKFGYVKEYELIF